MEEVYKELDEVKMEMEKLKAEYRIKTEFSESLKKAHNEQLIKFQESKLQIETQAQELNAKIEEISEARQMYEDLKSCLHEKESIIRHLSSANEKLRADCGERVQKLGGENRELVLALDESMVRNKDLEQKICAHNEEIEGLKRLLSVADKKCFETEQKAQASKELRQRDEVIAKLEEENCNVQEQLKWKKEQFEHLEEAHKRLHDQFQSSKEEWKREKSALLEEISSLQTRLDSQTRISEGLQIQLKMCNQALVHEESRRTILEVQLAEYNLRFENVFAVCEEAQSKTIQSNEEIAKLRNLLGTKETLFKEMEFRIVHLEQENQELLGSLKELQEAQINNAGAAAALTKLRNKLRGLEKVHSNCSKNLKARESEWSSQMEKMKCDTNGYISELKGKEKHIQELQMELEGCHFSFEVLNEEMAVVLVVLKSEFSEAFSKLLFHLEQEHREVSLLLKRVESVDLMEQQRYLLEKELEGHKKMLEESSTCQHRLKEQVCQMEKALKEDRRDASEALKKANCDLAEKMHEKGQLEFELQKWKSIAENLKVSLEESQKKHEQMETSLLAKVETQQTLEQEKESFLHIMKEHERKTGDLQQQIVLLETSIAAKMEAVEGFRQEKENYLRIAEEKDKIIENLHKKITCLELESMGREFEAAILVQLDAEKTFEQEKERLPEVTKAKDQSIEDLRVLAMSLEQDFTSARISSFSEVTEKQIEIDVLSEALNKAEYLRKVEIPEKNKIIAEKEREVNDLCQKLEFKQESLFNSKQQVEQLEFLLEAKKSEVEKLTYQFESERRSLKGLIKELKFEKVVLLEDLSSEREDILVHIQETCDRIGEFSCEDTRLMEILGKILQTTEEKNGGAMDFAASDELNDTTRKCATTPLSPATMKVKAITAERLPLKEFNH